MAQNMGTTNFAIFNVHAFNNSRYSYNCAFYSCNCVFYSYNCVFIFVISILIMVFFQEKEHGIHHKEFDCNFCIFNGWANPVGIYLLSVNNIFNILLIISFATVIIYFYMYLLFVSSLFNFSLSLSL